MPFSVWYVRREHLFIVIAALFYGTVVVGGEFFLQRGFSLFEVTFYPVLFMTLVALPFVLLKPQYSVPAEKLLFFAVFGLIGAFAEFGQFVGLIFEVPVAVVALALYTQPVWTVLLGAALLGERLTRRKMTAAVLAFVGASVLLLGSWTFEIAHPVTGLGISLFASVLISLWVIWGRKSGISQQHYITTTFGWGASTTVWLLVLWPVLNRLSSNASITRLSADFPTRYWTYLLLFAICGGVIPSFCFFKGLRVVEASVAGIILLVEPVSAALLAAILLGQSLDVMTFAGGTLILASSWLTSGAARPIATSTPE